MSSNPNNKGKGGGQGPRKRGFIFGAILWALVLVIFFNFLAKQIANAGTKEVPYSEFIQMVEEDKVATVELTSNKYTFYLKEDLPAGAGKEAAKTWRRCWPSRWSRAAPPGMSPRRWWPGTTA